MNKQKMLMALPVLAVFTLLTTSLVVAGAYSIRADGGDIFWIGSHTDLSNEYAKLNAYVSPGSSGTGQGTIILRAETSSGERLNLNVKLSDAEVLVDSANLLRVNSNAYYYERVGGLTQKVEGQVFYEYNKNTQKARVIGYDGMIFKVADMDATLYVR